MPEESSITELLQRWSTGDPLALEALIPRVHGELHALAHLYLQRESHEATAPTSLVHDLYLRLLEERKIDWENRHHLFGIAARILCQLLAARARMVPLTGPRTDPYVQSYRIRLLPKVVTRRIVPPDTDAERGMVARTYG